MELSLWGIMYFLFNMSLNELNFPFRLRNVISENAERREFSTFVHQSSSPWTPGVGCKANSPESTCCFWRSKRSQEKCLSFFPPVEWELGNEMKLCSSCLKPLGKLHSSSTGQHYGNLLSGVLLKVKETIVLCDVPVETVVHTPLGVLGVVKIFR